MVRAAISPDLIARGDHRRQFGRGPGSDRQPGKTGDRHAPGDRDTPPLTFQQSSPGKDIVGKKDGVRIRPFLENLANGGCADIQCRTFLVGEHAIGNQAVFPQAVQASLTANIWRGGHDA